MIKRAGLTRIDLIVALSCLVFLFANIQVFSTTGRERSKLEVCMVNLRALTAAWQIYADDNSGKIPPGDVYYSWSFPSSGGGGPQSSWLEFPHYWPHPPIKSPDPAGGSGSIMQNRITNPTQADWLHSIAEGLLWKYIGDYKIYKCPEGDKGSYVTYSMSYSMYTYPGAAGPGSTAKIIKNRSQISKPAERFVFLDAGYAKMGAFYIKYDFGGEVKWYDPPPMRHNQGTTFSFADGHTIYRKWTDPHTLQAAKIGWGQGTVDTCDCDLRWMTKATWGDIPYDCTNPAKNCED
jgi:prepilin-type processing-associated H-X9-DG protein